MWLYAENVRKLCNGWLPSSGKMVATPLPFPLPQKVRRYPSSLTFSTTEEGSRVKGVLWKLTPECEKSLDFYEGYPHLYGKEAVLVQGTDGVKREVMAYIMNAPYKDQLAIPSDLYFMGIVEGCHQNRISSRSITDALKRTRQEVGREKPSHKKTEVSR